MSYFRYTTRDNTGLNITIATSPVAGYGNVWFIAALTGLVIAMTVSFLFAASMASLFLSTAGRRLYNQMFDVVLRAPMYFYETNPVGKF